MGRKEHLPETSFSVEARQRALALKSHSTRTKEFQWKAADFIANNIRLAQGASVIQCNLLDNIRETDTRPQNVCKFCKCVLPDTCHSRLLPRKVPGTKLKKLIERAQSMDNNTRRVHLSKFKLSLLKKCKSTPWNTLVLACSVCQKSQKYPLRPFYRPSKERRNPIIPTAKTSEKKKKKKKQSTKSNAGLKLVTTTKLQPSKEWKTESSTGTFPKKALPESAVKIASTQQKNMNKPTHKVKGKVEKTKGTPDFLKKLKKGNKLAGLIAQDAVSKKDNKNNPKSSIFALLHGWVGK